MVYAKHEATVSEAKGPQIESHGTAPYLNDDGYVDFAPNDPDNPQNWPTPRRWLITSVTILLVLNATFASSAISGAFESVVESFHVSLTAAGLTVTLFLLGYCAGPLFFAPLSEFYGRRWIFYATFTLYLLFNFLCAFAPNYGSLLVGRLFTGTLVSAPLSNAPGVLADLWNPIERGTAMAAFAATLWAGSALGPIVGGFLQLEKDWQWVFYVLMILGGATGLLMFLLPETHAPTILRARARRIREAKIPGYEAAKAPADDTDRSLSRILKIDLTRPWIILFDPISFFCAIYLSVVYTLMYMLFEIYPIIFRLKRGWKPGVSELPLLGTIVGCIIASGIIVIDTKKRGNKIKRGDATMADFVPEDRLGLAMIGGIGFSVSMFWFAWTGEFNSIHWIVPTLSGTLLSFSLLLVFVSFLNYIVDTYLLFAASAIAANTIVRSACGAAAPLFTVQMFKALGVGGGGSLIGGVAALLAIIPFLFKKYGKQIRERSKFAPTKPQAANQQSESINRGEVEELAVMTAYEAYAKSMYSLQGIPGGESHENRYSYNSFNSPTEWPVSA
ncbi:major facilitator superfamily protein [Hirsutella rhossiliensis]|uniref:Major facilitator superfamily domain-containing protein n=1 Tax=Hirsutella rhossiliensis TaxID=111463 RepID=A0A9P8SFP4_9HYPO|nr:major facilitator superfamily domain-containing protein [Hirsutella rhossiliensis]KAH0961143.1 major facilitator superfamily domain-containing protein [Hirsutella rhossiliensis]